jgi:integron integrase
MALAASPPRLLERVRLALRARHYSLSTEDAYVGWVRRYVLFHEKRNPELMGQPEIDAYLTHLAVDENVSASTQNQALAALLFLYRVVLGRPFGDLEDVVRARPSDRLPVVLSKDEVRAVLSRLRLTTHLVALLLYGSGMRLIEALRLRVKDVDFDASTITVRDGKGRRDRRVGLPQVAVSPLRVHLALVRARHERELAEGRGRVMLPEALERKFPSAAKQWGWQWVFPGPKPSRDPRTGITRIHHLQPTYIQRSVARAVREAGIVKPASCHTFRHSFATHLLQDGYDIRTVQDLLGHKDVATTMVYTHVLSSVGGRGVRSPADGL